ncbi:carbohydrate ABC transporter permease [Oceanispirochaeta sp.]|jgi:multiple sugar transport system permease protein|uniref:carbohydrate ABC transporter permease n=1 Tax=Oceanispirochaeta sp. TaxID=2035350 RepID=UPI00261FF6D4|nr:sugar ABC transporter permease [Oceanispirochaeta sp.]MDA3955764.1 sugar ABC transporter permease [Oceanispirochaeta sp.]
MTGIHKKKVTPYIFIAPQMVGYLLFVLGPLIAVLVYSFQDRNLLTGINQFVGLQNFSKMFRHDPIFWKTIGNTITFSLGQVPLNILLSLAIAIMLSRQFRGVGFFRTLFFSPVVTSAVAWAIVWKFLLQGGEQGAVNALLGIIGIQGPNWLFEPGWAMFSVIINRVLKNLGMNVIIFLAAVMNLPQHYYEAARIDGAGRIRIFLQITVPLLMPTLLMVTIITVIGSLKVFDTILLLTAGGPSNSTMVLVYYIYYQAFQFFQYGYASAVALVLFVFVLVLTAIQWSTRKRISHYEN